MKTDLLSGCGGPFQTQNRNRNDYINIKILYVNSNKQLESQRPGKKTRYTNENES